MADQDDELLIDTLDDGAVAIISDVPLLDEDGKLADLPEGAVRQDDGSVIYTLRYPRTLKYRRASDGRTREEPVTSLHLHRLTGADMMAVGATKGEMIIVVAVAKSTRINEARMRLIFQMLDAEDANAAGEVVSSFLGTGQKTGR